MEFDPVKFIPVATERIWGGSLLKSWFQVDREAPIGEYWVVSGHPNGMSVVANGKFAGKTINELTERHPEAYLGKSPQSRFPLLIKFIEAADDLSVQIHPDDAYADEHEGDFGKTEAWYILDHEPGAEMIFGHTFESKQEYLKAVKDQRVHDYLRRVRIEKEQVVFVPARTLHALLAGTVLIEIQQTSDVTYRMYDWDRTDASGKPRTLHIEKAADVLIYEDNTSPISANQQKSVIRESEHMKHEHLLTCPYFTIEKLSVFNGQAALESGRAGNPDVLIVAGGEGELVYRSGDSIALTRGDAVLIPGTLDNYRVSSRTEIQLIRTYY